MKIRINPVYAPDLLLATLLACNFPGASASVTENAPTQAAQLQLTEERSNLTLPAGEPVLTIQPGRGYLFASAQIVTGSNERDVWWNGVTLVPGQLIASLGRVEDLSTVTQISASAILERELQPVPGEAYVMATVDGKYVLLRMLSLGSQGEVNVEWMYPFTGEVLP
jgi:hypothetical protein